MAGAGDWADVSLTMRAVSSCLILKAKEPSFGVLQLRDALLEMGVVGHEAVHGGGDGGQLRLELPVLHRHDVI